RIGGPLGAGRAHSRYAGDFLPRRSRRMSRLSPHPRLCFSAEHLRRAAQPADWPPLLQAQQAVERIADERLHTTTVEYAHDTHNGLLNRARRMQGYVVTLGLRWHQSGDERYRQARLEHVREIGRWRYWSWITMRRGDDRPEAIFDLS